METTSQTPSHVMQHVVTDSARALLTGLIDYAGLFPPATLSMAEAVANYETYLHGPYGWILGRFIVPVARLEEFEKALAQRPDSKRDLCWKLSAIASEGTVSEVSRILAFNCRHERARSSVRAEIESVELRPMASARLVELASSHIPSELETYFEIPLTWQGRSALDGVAKCRRRAKIRMGGETPGMFPPAKDVALFLELCAARKVPFKATAGLHHAVRGVHPCTSDLNSPKVEMQGFLNLFLAAASAYHAPDQHSGDAILYGQTHTIFHFHEESIQWDLGGRVSLEQISAARREFATSFGSCSFTEPVDHLRAMYVL
ncbi:MAG TPA: hypothetical protein VMI10_04470 [Terriglobales bacterium]|nr:hypothetical protein [Terriglobales bacterium]